LIDAKFAIRNIKRMLRFRVLPKIFLFLRVKVRVGLGLTFVPLDFICKLNAIGLYYKTFLHP